MNHVNDAKYLFEVSWEVCNKVGGIYTVLKTKINNAVKHFGDNYFLIGPDFGNNPEFEETSEDIWEAIKGELHDRNLTCRFGRCHFTGSNPRVILVNQNNKYRQDELLFQLWQDFGVNSMSGEWDYIEPVLFSTACGEVIEVLYEKIVNENEVAVAQFHEWMSTAGMLYIKKHVPEIATVFTSHATMLGRALAGHGTDIYTNLEDISPNEMATKMNVTAKHSLETVSARECDCFTTVSEITAREASHFLQRAPQVILPNGINIDDIPDITKQPEGIGKHREALLNFASKFLQKDLDSETTQVLIISGRYEFRNKGIDLFLESLNSINHILKEETCKEQIVALFSVVGGHFGISNETQQILKGKEIQRGGFSRICTHQLQYPQHDPIWNKCNSLNLLNAAEDNVNIIFMPVYLDGYDGLLNMPYYDVLSGCDLGVFPSYYEPWGYTPLESIAYSVPTITTDLAGFGLWVKNLPDYSNKGVIILEYYNKSYEEIVDCLTKNILQHLKWSKEEINDQKRQARKIAERADWNEFYPFYLKAYSTAAKMASHRRYSMDTSAYTRELVHTGTDSIQPRFKSFSVIAEMPESINRLRDIAYNLWWTWNPEAQELFAKLNPKLWAEVSNNPLELLERVSYERLEELAVNESYLRLYNRVLESFEDSLKDKYPAAEVDPSLTKETPIAYFSTEYGFHESLPIYSGGLGILSGDHLKSASDLNVPLIGVGLLYKNGYFSQTIDKEGNQAEHYPENDFSRMPVRVLDREKGEPLRISVTLPGRKLYAQAWEIDVGRVKLYLLDTAVPENNNQDMEITSRLYGADQRLRIEQEIMLGIGGVRLLEALDIKPSIFHLNEGHSAFLLLERIRQLIQKEGLSFNEARVVVKTGSVFTTHSPVEAANERFEQSLMKHYFSDYIKDLGISWNTLWELGHYEPGEDKPFFMSVLALKLCCVSNAVSKLHGEISRKHWRKVWSGFGEDEIPITHITNGVHIQSWIAPELRALYETYIGIDWYAENFDISNWDKVSEIPDALLWQKHMDIKANMIDFLKSRMARDMERQGLTPKLIEKKIESLSPNAMIIGFGRRFATYKRGHLMFSDPERLSQILDDPDRPVQIIFGGKAHPNDEEGKKIIKNIYSYTLDESFMDKIFFVENYDMEIARHLVQGVDVWLNNPIRPQEASGTSGMKVVVNGGLNFSILDGWWDEGFTGTNGWSIGEGREYANLETQNLVDSQNLYDTLENSVIPSYYNRSSEGIPEKWVYIMKESISTLVPRFNTHRMLREYYEKMYLPASRRAAILSSNNYERARALADWKLKIASRFSTVHIKWFKTKGFRGDSLNIGDEFKLQVGVELGKLAENEIQMELVVAEPDEGKERLKNQSVIIMDKDKTLEEEGVVIYSGKHKATKSGKFVYGIRAMPSHPDLLRYHELGLVHWG
ncbi:MAG: alpha-glucan family phosphorylase [Syntrophales bacterium]|nr:alpha-glucan family phosphorylase [Syntrophales bacterium]